MRLLLCIVVAALVAPEVAAQTPTTSCTRECDPRAPDVNAGPLPRTDGSVNVFLYATPGTAAGEWELATTHGNATESVVPLPPASECAQQSWPFHAANAGFSFFFLGPANLSGPSKVYAYLERQRSPAGLAPGPFRLEVSLEMIDQATGISKQKIASGTSNPFGGPTAFQAVVWEVPVILTNAASTIPAWSPEHPVGLRASLRLCSDPSIPGGPRPEWALASGPKLPNRVILNVSQPLIPAGITTSWTGGSLCVGVAARPVFGTRDIDDASTLVRFQAPNRQVHWNGSLAVLRSAAEGPQFDNPTRATGCGPLEGVSPGDSISVVGETNNRQGTFKLVQTAAVAVPGASALPAPSVGMVALMVVLALVLRRP